MANSYVLKALETIEKHGFLLEADADYPSLATMIAGAPIKGSWWGHPNGKLIFNTASEIVDHGDVLCGKLVKGKVTYLHRKLWPELVSIGLSQDVWQTNKLPLSSNNLLKKVEKLGQVRADALPGNPKDITGAIKRLESRLLLHSQSIHTESGKHVKQLESWTHFSKRHKLKRSALNESYRKLNELMKDLPWQKGST